MVRVNTPPPDDTLYHLAAKFGAAPADAAALMQEASRQGCAVGLALHVGPPCRTPAAYLPALALLAQLLATAGVPPRCIHLGVRFPAASGPRTVTAPDAPMAP